MEHTEQNIIDKTMAIFMKLGIKSVTMDDISRQLGISKKTLYKFVTDKNDLVNKTLTVACEYENNEIQKICDLGLNAIDEAYEISYYVAEHIKTLHPSIVYDIQKYHPDAWSNFSSMKHDKILSCYSNNMERGIKEGLYRDDLNIPIIANYYIEKFDLMFNEELFPRDQFSAADIYTEMFRYHIRGMASDKGRKYLAEKMQKQPS